MIRNVTIAAIVQRPNILDSLEIRSNTSCVIRYWVVEDGRVQDAPTHEPAYTPALYVDRVSYEASSERVSFGFPTPNSVAQCKFLKSLIGRTMAYLVEILLGRFRLHSE